MLILRCCLLWDRMVLLLEDTQHDGRQQQCLPACLPAQH